MNKGIYISNKLEDVNYKAQIIKDYYLYYETIFGKSIFQNKSLKSIENYEKSILEWIDSNYICAKSQYLNMFNENSNHIFYGLFKKDTNELIAHTSIERCFDFHNFFINIALLPIFITKNNQKENNSIINFKKSIYEMLYNSIIEESEKANTLNTPMGFLLYDKSKLANDTLSNFGYERNDKGIYTKILAKTLKK